MYLNQLGKHNPQLVNKIEPLKICQCHSFQIIKLRLEILAVFDSRNRIKAFLSTRDNIKYFIRQPLRRSFTAF